MPWSMAKIALKCVLLLQCDYTCSYVVLEMFIQISFWKNNLAKASHETLTCTMLTIKALEKINIFKDNNNRTRNNRINIFKFTLEKSQIVFVCSEQKLTYLLEKAVS